MREKVSVRDLVAFTYHAHDLLPGVSMAQMREGTLGHKARQRELKDAQCEVQVSCEVVGEDVTLEISGRIDALYMRAGIPVVEEMKLAYMEDPPTEADEAHFAQAMCYGHMICLDAKHEYVLLRVLYVRRDGGEVTSFERLTPREALQTQFDALVQPYLAWVTAQAAWRKVRDASLVSLAFPHGGYRAGQRDLAVQAYWAIREGRRLFAMAPTGTGKTVATLFPALKALAEGKTAQIFYLTARTTVRQAALDALKMMRGQGIRLRVLELTAKEKLCPHAGASDWRCDVLECPEAIGFYDRLEAAVSKLCDMEDWPRAQIEEVAREFTLCPLELSLALCEIADVVVCDYNYAFDPGVRIKRVFEQRTDVTLLVDEAHNLLERARGMLSAALDSGAMRELRREVGKIYGRKRGLYPVIGKLIRVLEQRDGETEAFTREDLPEGLPEALESCMDAALNAFAQEMPHMQKLSEASRTWFEALMACQRFGPQYTALYEPHGAKEAVLTLLCLDPAPYLQGVTKKLRGCVFFSATLVPLSAYRTLLGGVEEDALLSLPSPFPWENLLVLRRALSTRYQDRAQTAPHVARALLACVRAHPGNYLACFPSYQYLLKVRDELLVLEDSLPLLVQRSGMDEAARAEFLEAFAPRTEGHLLGMIVLGGAFGEGVDLPGDRLHGVIVVGVGLPQICPERETLRTYYEAALGDGFSYAYVYPGMNKVLQAVGRVIRTDTDRGVALLIDDRFLHARHARLMPPHWANAPQVKDEAAIQARLATFWAANDAEPCQIVEEPL